jgi:hypothetical protein
MKKNIVILAMSITVIGAKAQSSAVKPDSTTAAIFKKNEIGVNVSPILVGLLNNSLIPQENRLSVSYKRILNKKSALRFALGVDNNGNLESSQSKLNDTTFYKHYNFSSTSPFIRLGYERYFGKHKIKWFYGADIVVGKYKSSYSYTNSKSWSDNSSNKTFNETSSTIEINNENNYLLGISPFIGTKYPLSKRFSISAQLGFDTNFQSGYFTQNATNTSSSKKTKSSIVNMNSSPGIINDFSIIYKF